MESHTASNRLLLLYNIELLKLFLKPDISGAIYIYHFTDEQNMKDPFLGRKGNEWAVGLTNKRKQEKSRKVVKARLDTVYQNWGQKNFDVDLLQTAIAFGDD